jgi:uncharacterized membrane-anchored protein
LILAGALLTGHAHAQAPGEARERALFQSIQWKRGPLKADLGNVAQVAVPAGYLFVQGKDMAKFNELNQNPHNPQDLGALIAPEHAWFIVFTFEDIGYVKDDEKDQLDAAAILESIREGNDAANEERLSRGWGAVEVTGWEQPPFFDPQTKNLTWAIRGISEGRPIVNYNSRILGRGGVMSANLIVDWKHLKGTIPTYKKLLGGFAYKPGQTYAEWRPGDKVAAVGLTALIAGGATAIAAKSGLLAKLGKGLVAVVVGIGAAISSLFKKVFGGRSSSARGLP